MSHRRLPVIDSVDAAVQATCAAILYELLRADSWEDLHRRAARVPDVLAELKLTPTWRRVLVAAARWMCDGETQAPAILCPCGYETSLFPEVFGGFVSTALMRDSVTARIRVRCTK
jgi:hypothetical protein